MHLRPQWWSKIRSEQNCYLRHQKSFRSLIFLFFLIFSGITAGCYKEPPKEPYRIQELKRLIIDAERFSEKDPERALALYKEALKKSRLLQDDKSSLIILLSLSRLLTSNLEIPQERIEEARDLVNSAKALLSRSIDEIPLELLEELRLEEARLILLSGKLPDGGELTSVTGVRVVEDLLKEIINSPSENIRIRALNLLGRLYIKKGLFDLAEKSLIESIKINNGNLKMEEANSHRLLGEVYMSKISGTIGGVSNSYGTVQGKNFTNFNFQQAEYHFQKALLIDRELGLPYKIGMDMEALARLYREAGDKRLAKEYYLRALEIWRLQESRERARSIEKALEELQE
jgi:tetratricopeptide (TPR) repeat protein